MPDSQSHRAGSEQIIAIRFRMKATADEVIARLLEAVRRTDLSLLTVFGDKERVYPFEGRNSARAASSWRAELFWSVGAPNQGWHLEVFIRRAELFLDCPGGVRLEMGGGRRDLRETVAG